MAEPSADRRLVTVAPTIRQCVQAHLIEHGERETIEEQALSVMCDNSKTARTSSYYHVPLPHSSFDQARLRGRQNLADLHYRVAKVYARTKHNTSWLRNIMNEPCRLVYEDNHDSNHSLAEDARQALKKLPANDQVVASGSQRMALVGADTMFNRVAWKKQELLELGQSADQQHSKTIRKASDLAAFQRMHGGTEDAEKPIRSSYELCLARFTRKSRDSIQGDAQNTGGAAWQKPPRYGHDRFDAKGTGPCVK
ncbi:hypothetical protein F5B21DRAFT_498642 [Xylaria acuta]|nr:hypothetical protein F5B21DRAFT_498642 [Xylaria acuta]